MRIITWNCKMAYRNKAEHIKQYQPDIVVVPECEKFGEQTTKQLWFGDNKNKGLGIFSYKDYELEIHPQYNPLFRYVILIKVMGKIEFNLLAIWAMNDTTNVKQRYIGQVYSAINYYKNLLEKPIIIVGDFNWNVIWDKKPDYPLCGTLGDTISILKNKHVFSTYHQHTKDEFGKETKSTLYMYHRKNKPYHIDYCFACKLPWAEAHSV